MPELKNAVVVGTVALTVLAGCALDRHNPDPQPSAPSSPSARRGDCQPPHIDLKTNVGDGPAVNAVRKVTISGSRRTEDDIKNEPIIPTLAWTSEPLTDDDSIWASMADQGGTREPGPGLTDAEEALAGIQSASGTFVGYAAATRVTVTVAVTCPDGRHTTGDVTSWTSSEVGVVACTRELPANAPAIATAVLHQFC